MLEKPDLPVQVITDCLASAYDLHVADLTFLPIGYDALAWVFNVTVVDGRRFFLKLRKGPIYAASLAVPAHLYEQGIGHVVAPLPALSAKRWAETSGYSLILYPYIEGVIAAEIGLTDEQWFELGRVLASIHTATLPDQLRKRVQVETYTPPWIAMIRKLDSQIERSKFNDPISQALAAEWRQRNDEIRAIVVRTEELGRQLAARAPERLLCHADIHEHNILVDPHGGLHIVDWDGIVLAPRERDLMFVVDGTQRERSTQEQRFFDGYGDVEIDPVGLAYYRFEWVVQEIGDCGERVLLSPSNGELTRQSAVQDFVDLFLPGDVVDGAYGSDPNRDGSAS